MNTTELHSLARFGGITALVGSVCMIIGAVLWGTSGTDLWHALDNGGMSEYLRAAGEVKIQLVANLTFWIIGVLFLGIAGTIMAVLSEQRKSLARAAVVCLRTGVPMAIISFIAMLSLVVQIAPNTSAVSVSIAEVVGWIGARTDDIATTLIVGAMPVFISLAGRGSWVPNFLVLLSYLAGISGLISIIVLYIPELSQLGFIIVPIGLAWMISAGVVLLRMSRRA